MARLFNHPAAIAAEDIKLPDGYVISVWLRGKPVEPGVYNASESGHIDVWRYWNGKRWSRAFMNPLRAADMADPSKFQPGETVESKLRYRGITSQAKGFPV